MQGCSHSAMDKYEQVKQLGKGSYGTVFLVRERSSRAKLWCMKKINLQGLGPRAREICRQVKLP